MRQDSKNMVNNFLIKGFPVKRQKNEKGKWERVIIVTDGYVRKGEKRYKWVRGINVHLVAADLIQLLINVFSVTQEESEELVYAHINKCKL